MLSESRASNSDGSSNVSCGLRHPEVITFNATMSACEKCGRWEAALQLLRELEEALWKSSKEATTLGKA